MIKRIEINCVHTTADETLQKYLKKKIGRLDRYIPRHARDSAHADIKLKETKAKDKNGATCEVTLHLPHEVINVSETTVNMYAAIDILEMKLKNQIKKYKDLHSGGTLRRRLAQRFQRRATVQADVV